MLRHLYIKDYIIIDELNLDFYDGMSAFTGETGAGKSIIIDAIAYLCGKRLTTNVVAANKEKTVIEAVLTISNPMTLQVLKDAGFDESEEYVLSREITSDMKSVMRLNYRTITQAFAQSLTENLIDIHNQRQTQYLLNEKNHLTLLDSFCNEKEKASTLKAAYQEYAQANRKYQDALNNDFNVNDKDYLLYQKNEIEELNMAENENEELEARQKKMQLFEKSSLQLEKISGDMEALDSIYDALKALNELEDADLDPLKQKLNDQYYEMLDVKESLEDYRSHMSFDENELNAIQTRLYEINRILRKYGNSYASLMENYQEICEKIERIDHREEYLADLEKEVSEKLAVYQKEAEAMSRIRREKAKELEKLVVSQLKDLELPHTLFEIEFSEKAPSASGNDFVRFLISTNVGQALEALSEVASGGELSRIMLGLKSIFNSLAGIETVIFDEIDTGVSGKIATSIGRKMQEIAKKAQVLTVTHLGQVAGCSDYHYFVSKKNDTVTTVSEVRLLDREGRIHELAKIATGIESESALKSAEELLDSLHHE